MPCVDNKNLIYNIKELPETFSVAAGDLLIIETEEGTNIMDFANFVVGLDNTTFGTTITQNTTDIATLSTQYASLTADVQSDIDDLSAAAIGSTTKALISLSAADQNGARLIVGTNIANVSYNAPILRAYFTTDLPNFNYLVLPAAAVAGAGSELVQVVESAKNTSYVDLSVINLNTGTLATSATSVGFQIQTF